MLVDKGHKVIVFDNNRRGKINRIKNKNIKFIKGDIRSLKDLNKAIRGVNVVIH